MALHIQKSTSSTMPDMQQTLDQRVLNYAEGTMDLDLHMNKSRKSTYSPPHVKRVSYILCYKIPNKNETLNCHQIEPENTAS